MRRRKFMKMAGLLATVPAIKGFAASNESSAKAKEIYEWRVYTLTADKPDLDKFYQDVLIPAYNRKKISVGAFKPFKPTDKIQRYYLFVYPDLATYQKVKADIWKDAAFKQAAQPFYDASAAAPVYTEFESFLCEAFDKVPQLKKPDANRTLFEWRNYKSPNEEANQRKIKMFNVDEIAVFDQTGVNSVCYGEVLAGPRSPSLIYLTWYKDEPTRDEAWKKFSAHPEWRRISRLPEYAHTATDNKAVLLSPLPYSQI
jgi:hypothetical protein